MMMKKKMIHVISWHLHTKCRILLRHAMHSLGFCTRHVSHLFCATRYPIYTDINMMVYHRGVPRIPAGIMEPGEGLGSSKGDVSQHGGADQRADATAVEMPHDTEQVDMARDHSLDMGGRRV